MLGNCDQVIDIRKNVSPSQTLQLLLSKVQCEQNKAKECYCNRHIDFVFVEPGPSNFFEKPQMLSFT